VPFPVIIAIFFSTAFAEPKAIAPMSVKPTCAAIHVGKMWPDDANRDTKMLRAAAQNGELEVCSKHRDGYRWETVSVNVKQLRAEQCCSSTANLVEDDLPPPGDEVAAPTPPSGPARPRRRLDVIRRFLGI
jgi:hypothetical protein